ncbi:MAG TPA: OmpA family protein [Flavisolibacter sp.]|nr:OmpA family protein [Flavisolibacter sp.]
MAFNLLDSVRSYLTPDLIDKASRHFGESSSGMGKAISAAIPALLGLFINRAERGDAQGLLDDARDAANSNAFQQPQNLFSGGMGSVLSDGIHWLQNRFGSAGTDVSSAISSFSGIKSESARGLFGMLAPVGLGVLGRHAQESNLSAQGLSSYLADQKPAIMNALPSGLNLGFLFGDRPREVHAASSSDRSHTHHETVHEEKRTNWLPWLLLALGAIALIYFLTRNGCNGDDAAVTTTDSAGVNTTVPDSGISVPPPVTTTRQNTQVQLANGTMINAYKGGVEDQLVACLNDAGCTAGNDRWFDFDNINFETASARLTDSSQVQVQNIVAILKAYPNAKIKIGGYTDKTGNDADNQRLSQQRADAVLAAIKTAGGNAAQLVGAEGYGSAFAKVAATASDEERKTDRRIAVQLREK